MPAGDPALVEIMRDAIRRHGPVSFAWFMEQALYHPEHGYYGAGRCAIGRRGDYFTNVSVGPLFGRLLAAQFAEMWEVLGKPADFTIVEQGAHHGEFARDVLEAARDRLPEFFGALKYSIVEPFPVLQARQRATLKGFEARVGWCASIDELKPFCGVHFSNEFLDAMPVHLVGGNAQQWHEKYVTQEGDAFVLVDGPISTPRLQNHLQKIPPLPPGEYETEVNLAALDWIVALAQKLKRGYLLAVDYGYSRAEFYSPSRTKGTLRSYSQHQVLSSPFEAIGHADVTAHVDWTSLAECAKASGLRLAGFTDQHHFITGLLAGRMRDEFGADADSQTRRALQTLLHPNFLGMTFQFLGFSKDAATLPALAGFRFARDPGAALGLSSEAASTQDRP